MTPQQQFDISFAVVALIVSVIALLSVLRSKR